MQKSKYIALADEAGSWTVISVETDIPAVLDGVPQVGLSQEQADEVAETLNAMTDDEDG